jgi:hypothetical protein
MTQELELNSNNLHIFNSDITFCQLNSFGGNCNVYTVLLNVSGVVSPDGIRQIPFTVLVRYNVGYSSNSDGQLVQNWECLGLESVGKLEEGGVFRVNKTAEEFLLGNHYFADIAIKILKVPLYQQISSLFGN